MKKLYAFLLIAIFALVSAACSVPESDDKKPDSDMSSQSQENEGADEYAGQISSVPEFYANDIGGQDVDNSIFKDYKLTMINIWGTFCPPCIEEMPELQKLYENMAEQGVNVVGIIGDTPDSDNEEMARQIVAQKGVKFINLVPDQNLLEGIVFNIDAYPTTIFVDSEGSIVGDPLVGARSMEDYEAVIDDILEGMK